MKGQFGFDFYSYALGILGWNPGCVVAAWVFIDAVNWAA
jgi:uncharacterized membrane protein YqaE (UPF0057 family)